MAYDRRDGQTVYKLAFPDRPGLTVRVRRASLAGMIDLAEAAPVLRRNVQRAEAQTEVENLRAWRRLARAFASALIDWDLFDGGVPVPATFAGVMSLELDEVMDLVSGWRQAMRAPRSPALDELDELDPQGDAEGSADEVDGVDEEWLAQLPTQVTPEAAVPSEVVPDEAEVMADA